MISQRGALDLYSAAWLRVIKGASEPNHFRSSVVELRIKLGLVHSIIKHALRTFMLESLVEFSSWPYHEECDDENAFSQLLELKFIRDEVVDADDFNAD
jgi:hypothetical protein